MRLMVFLHSLLGANLFLVVYLGYSQGEFVIYASCQLMASSIVILLETPLLQHFLANRTETSIPLLILRGKAFLAGLAGISALEPMGLIPDPILLVVALVSAPTSWQVTARTHSSQSLFFLLVVRTALLFFAFVGIPLTIFIILFSLVSSFCAYILSLSDKRSVVSSVASLCIAYRAKASFAIRPVAESIAFNAATVFVIKQLPTSDASLFYLFLRVISAAISVTQNALYTEAVELRWHSFIERVGPMALATAIITSLIGAVFGSKFTVLNACVFIGGTCVVVLSQYFGSFRVKQMGLWRLDMINGVLFSLGLAAIAIISLTNKNFQSIAFTYIAVEAAIGLYSYRVISQHV